LVVIAAQHLALREPRDDYIGIINLKTSPLNVAREAVCVAFLCRILTYARHSWPPAFVLHALHTQLSAASAFVA
jgi:hypothetical protein